MSQWPPKLLSEQGCPCEGHPEMESRPWGWVSSSWKRIQGKSQCFQGGQEGRRLRREFLSAAGAVAQRLLGARGEAQGRCTHVRDDLTGRSVLCPSLPAPPSPSPWGLGVHCVSGCTRGMFCLPKNLRVSLSPRDNSRAERGLPHLGLSNPKRHGSARCVAGPSSSALQSREEQLQRPLCWNFLFRLFSRS